MSNPLIRETNKIGEILFEHMEATGLEPSVYLIALARVLAAMIMAEPDADRAREVVLQIFDHTKSVAGSVWQ